MGHIKRMSEMEIPVRALDTNPEGRTDVGR
jgi:hypothetical protein